MIFFVFNKDTNCVWKFHSYIPSAWEIDWYSNIEKYQNNVCLHLAESHQVNKSIDVVRRLISLQNSLFINSTTTNPIDIHLSQMHYFQTCQGKTFHVSQLIEPLIGLIRDPLSMCPRLPSVPSDLYLEGEFSIQSKRFLLLAPSSPFQINPTFPSPIPALPPWLYLPGSQKILIDIGSSYFKSRNGNTAEIGTKWFYDYFHEKSLRFDRIIAYEYQPLDTRRVWEELPADVVPIYTFINIGVEENTNGRFNPWTLLRTLAKPSDYVVLKLDIDKPPLENALIVQLFDEKNFARDLVDELFFEKHISTIQRSNENRLKDTYELFTKLRQIGIRMHGWP